MITLNYIRGCQRLCGISNEDFIEKLKVGSPTVSYISFVRIREHPDYRQGELNTIAKALGLNLVVYFEDENGNRINKKTALIDGDHIRDCYKRCGLSAKNIREKLEGIISQAVGSSTFSAFLSRKAEQYKQGALSSIAEALGYKLVIYFVAVDGMRIPQIDR